MTEVEPTGKSRPPVAVVTGGAQGIGGATVATLLAQGWRVHVIDREEPRNSGARGHLCDVAEEVELRAAAERIGPIDALVLCAGINLRPRDGPAEKLDIAAWNRTLAVNLTGAMLSVRAFRPKLRPDGAIVTLGSVAALRAMPLADAYTATKGAIVALTKSWAVDYSRDGIRVNCVCPGPTDTQMMEGVIEGFEKSQQLQLPQQRMATAQEVANVIAFLVSDAASYLSGCVIAVDGGATAHSAGMPFPRRRTV